MNDYNAGKRQHVRQAAKAAELADRQDEEFTTSLMSTLAGRAWMWRKLVACHVYQISHTGNALQTAFLEGERNVGLQLLSAIRPDDLSTMMKEANVRDHTVAARRDAVDPADDPDDDPTGDARVERED